MAKPTPPHIVVLGDARITINAIPAQVFDALTNAERLLSEKHLAGELGGFP